MSIPSITRGIVFSLLVALNACQGAPEPRNSGRNGLDGGNQSQSHDLGTTGGQDSGFEQADAGVLIDLGRTADAQVKPDLGVAVDAGQTIDAGVEDICAQPLPLGPAVYRRYTTEPEPSFNGGTIIPGLYFMTEDVVYGARSDTVANGPEDLQYQVSYRLSAGQLSNLQVRNQGEREIWRADWCGAYLPEGNLLTNSGANIEYQMTADGMRVRAPGSPYVYILVRQ